MKGSLLLSLFLAIMIIVFVSCGGGGSNPAPPSGNSSGPSLGGPTPPVASTQTTTSTESPTEPPITNPTTSPSESPTESSTSSPTPSPTTPTPSPTQSPNPFIGSHNLGPGDKAYSPDGRYYATEMEPINQGNIGVYNLLDGSMVISWKFLDEGIHNDLKNMCWSWNSKKIAVIYHGGCDRNSIQIAQIDNENIIEEALVTGTFYHAMAFDDDNHRILLRESANNGEIITVTPTPLPKILN